MLSRTPSTTLKMQLLTLLCLTLPLWHLNPKREALTLTPEENRAEAARPALAAALAARTGVVAAAAVAELEVSTAAASAPLSLLPLKVAYAVSVEKASRR